MDHYHCPICYRAFDSARSRRVHLVESSKCNVVEELLRLRFLLADREEAVMVARRQRDEARLIATNALCRAGPPSASPLCTS
jgi:hypothetical protein